MERYENIVKLEEIRRLVDNNQYLKAIKILDTMDISRIKVLTDLSVIADVYSQNERYKDAMEVLNKIYTKTKTRRVLYQLVDLSIKKGSVEEAEDYLRRYIKVAPQDSYRFIFRYCIDKLSKEPYDILIASLEHLKEYEYIEVWAYELAKLYHKAGMKDKCVRECSDIVLWFGDGIYVEKARLLKAYYVGELDPIHMLKAKDKKEVEKKFGLDKTKDYSSIRSQINQFLAKDAEPIGEADQSEVDQSEADQSEADQTEAGQNDYENNNTQIEEEQETVLDQESIQVNNDEFRVYVKQFFKEKTINEILLEANPYTEDMEEESAVHEEIAGWQTGSYEEKNSYNAEDEIACNAEDETAYNTEEVPVYDHSDQQNIVEEIENHITYTEDTILNDTLETANDLDTINQYLQSESKSKFHDLFTEAGMDFKQIFGYFGVMDFCKRQVERCLENITNDYTKVNYMIITGNVKSGKTTLGKKMVKALSGLERVNANRIAKINAAKLNNINLSSQKDRLVNSTLIVEDAGLLSPAAAAGLLELAKMLGQNFFLILEDTEVPMNKLLSTIQQSDDVYLNLIQLPEFSALDLICFAICYMENNDYQFTKEVKTAFIQEIKHIIDFREENHLASVMEFACQTKKTADTRNKKALTEIINSRDFSSEDLMYIQMEDFYGRSI